MTNKKSTTTPGFTLIEVTVVLLIISIVFVASLPVTGRAASNFKLRHTANQMAADIREVQQRALSECNSGYMIRFRSDRADNYIIRKSSYPTPIVIDTVYLPPGIKIENTNFSKNLITFSAMGIPNMGGTIAIRNEKTGQYIYVIVAVITGRVRVADKPP